MGWTIELSATADKQLGKLDREVGKRIRKYLDRVAALTEPRSLGAALPRI